MVIKNLFPQVLNLIQNPPFVLPTLPIQHLLSRVVLSNVALRPSLTDLHRSAVSHVVRMLLRILPQLLVQVRHQSAAGRRLHPTARVRRLLRIGPGQPIRFGLGLVEEMRSSWRICNYQIHQTPPAANERFGGFGEKYSVTTINGKIYPRCTTAAAAGRLTLRQ